MTASSGRRWAAGPWAAGFGPWGVGPWAPGAGRVAGRRAVGAGRVAGRRAVGAGRRASGWARGAGRRAGGSARRATLALIPLTRPPASDRTQSAAWRERPSPSKTVSKTDDASFADRFHEISPTTPPENGQQNRRQDPDHVLLTVSEKSPPPQQPKTDNKNPEARLLLTVFTHPQRLDKTRPVSRGQLQGHSHRTPRIADRHHPAILHSVRSSEHPRPHPHHRPAHPQRKRDLRQRPIPPADGDHHRRRTHHQKIASLAQPGRNNHVDPPVRRPRIQTRQKTHRKPTRRLSPPARRLHDPAQPATHHHRPRRRQPGAHHLGHPRRKRRHLRAANDRDLTHHPNAA